MMADPRPAAGPAEAQSVSHVKRPGASPPSFDSDLPLDRTPPLQFGVRTILSVMTLAAIGFAVVSYVGSGLAGDTVLAMARLAVLLTAPLCFGTLALYCRGYRQTFFLGAFVGSVASMTQLQRSFMGGWIAMGVFFLANMVCAFGSGWLAVATRRFAERRGWHLPTDEGSSKSDR